MRERSHDNRASDLEADPSKLDEESRARSKAREPRRNLLSYLDGLARFGARDAYFWKDGVRWRSRKYAALHRRVLGCVTELSRLGVKPRDTVLIQGPETADWVEALFATLWLGGVAVPLNPETPDDFRAKVNEKVSAKILVAPPSVAEPPGVKRLDFGSWSESGDQPAPRHDSGPDERAEVIFTSGTTGDPKGVILTHGNLISDLSPIENQYRKWEAYVRPLGSFRFLSTLPFSHMFGQTVNIFIPLFLGFAIVLTPPRPWEILDAARRRRCWGLFTVPRVLDLLGQEVPRRLGDKSKLETLQKRGEGLPPLLQALSFWRVQLLLGWRFRVFVVGGAPLSRDTKRFWERMGYLVVQGYGLTETAPIVTISNPFDRQTEGVGHPLAGQDVKIGPNGEVLVRGPNVTAGYLGEKEKEAFEGEWFHTGDLGEIDPQGRLQIRGRLKDVIVMAEGEKVHAEDVQAALKGISGVRDACVIGVELEKGEQVHAVLLLDPGINPDDVIRQANEKLQPHQRVQSHTVWPEKDFPRTATGKVRKGAVREAVVNLRKGDSPGDAIKGARTDVRSLVARMAKVDAANLKDETRLTEQLGLGSLDLVELTGAIEEEFGLTLPEVELSTATVGELERLIGERGEAPETKTQAGQPAQGGPAIKEGVTPEPPPQSKTEGPSPAPSPPTRIRALKMPRWARRFPANLIRRVFDEVLVFPLVRFFANIEIQGLEKLDRLEQPFLLVANHRSYLDTVILKSVLRRPAKGGITPGMTTRNDRVFFGEESGSLIRYAREWIEVRLAQLLFHAWPLSESRGLRQSLSYAGELADAGFSPLIFPEGRHVEEGVIERFREGIGLFARELRAPIVPAYLEGTGIVLPSEARWPRPGKMKVTLGVPFLIEREADASEATRRIENAVLELAPPDVKRSEPKVDEKSAQKSGQEKNAA